MAFCVMVGLQWSLKSKGMIGSVVGAAGVIVAVAGTVGLCGWNAGPQVDVLGPVLSGLSPASLVLAVVQPVDGLDVGLGYTYLDADDPDGSIEVRRPRHEGGLTVAYTFLGGDATVSADARLVIGNFDTDFTAASFGNARVRLDDYVLVDVAGSYKVHEMVDLTLRVENLTDAEYQEQDGFAAQGIAGFGGVRLTF